MTNDKLLNLKNIYVSFEGFLALNNLKQVRKLDDKLSILLPFSKHDYIYTICMVCIKLLKIKIDGLLSDLLELSATCKGCDAKCIRSDL